MKIDYNRLMEEQIKNLTNKPKLLLHCCCAPCSSAVISRLKQYFDITLFYFNPNIYPEQEYVLRKLQFEKLGVDVVDVGYNHNDFLSAVAGLEQEMEGGARCNKCISQRMEKAFEYARANNFDFVTTTLSISPHKNAQFINTTGERLEKNYGVKYLYGDFKKCNGYLNSINLSKQYNLYRQDYCGCEFSLKSVRKK